MSTSKKSGKKNYPNVKKSNFALESKRKYPINSRQRAKSALGFAKMHHGTSSSTYKEVRREVKQKYPGLIKSDKGKNSNSKKKK